MHTNYTDEQQDYYEQITHLIRIHLRTLLAQKELRTDGEGYASMTDMAQCFNKRYERALHLEDIEWVINDNPYFDSKLIYNQVFIKDRFPDETHTKTSTHKRTNAPKHSFGLNVSNKRPPSTYDDEW